MPIKLQSIIEEILENLRTENKVEPIDNKIVDKINAEISDELNKRKQELYRKGRKNAPVKEVILTS